MIDGHRLAYIAEAPVNWCPGLGTVLANEEVTADGRSDRGNFPVFKPQPAAVDDADHRLRRPADRRPGPAGLAGVGQGDAAQLDRPLRGRARSASRADGGARSRCSPPGPDTLFGATYMVLAPEHPLVDAIAAPRGRRTSTRVDGRRADPADGGRGVPRARRARPTWTASESRDKTGVFTGAFATNPVNGSAIPVFVADYVLMGYGTGAIMAVPGQDQRDWEFAAAFGLPIVRTVEPPEGFEGEAYIGEGPAINSANAEVSLNGLGVAEAKRAIIDWLAAQRLGEATIHVQAARLAVLAGSATGASRSRSSATRRPAASPVPDDQLPVELPDDRRLLAAHLRPGRRRTPSRSRRCRARPSGRRRAGPGRRPEAVPRETNTMPQWAGSCWYELRYLDPTNEDRFVDAEVERYWMGPRGERRPRRRRPVRRRRRARRAAPAVRAVLAQGAVRPGPRVSSEEPYRRLFNQGYIQAVRLHRRARHRTCRPRRSSRAATAVLHVRTAQPVAPGVREDGQEPEERRSTPDEMYERYGADTLRLYEMSMGPLDVSRPWETRDVVGSYRFLQRVWRNLVDEETGELRGHRRGAGRADLRARCTARSPACATTWRRCASTPRSPS